MDGQAFGRWTTAARLLVIAIWLVLPAGGVNAEVSKDRVALRTDIALPHLQVEGGAAALGRAFGDDLRAALEAKGFHVADGASSEACNIDCAVALGWREGATYVALGTLIQHPRLGWVVTMRIHDGLDGRPLSAAVVNSDGIPGQSEAKEIAGEIAVSVLRDHRAALENAELRRHRLELAIVPFDGPGTSTEESRKLALQMHRGLAGKFAMPTWNAQAAKPEQRRNAGSGNCATRACTVQLGGALGVARIVAVQVTRHGDNWQAQARLLSMPDGRDSGVHVIAKPSREALLATGPAALVANLSAALTGADNSVAGPLQEETKRAQERAEAQRVEAERQRLLDEIARNPKPGALRILVVPLEGDTQGDTRVIRRELAARVAHTVIGSDETTRIVANSGGETMPCADAPCALEIARRGRADLVVYGRVVGRPGGRQRVQANLLHVASGRMLHSGERGKAPPGGFPEASLLRLARDLASPLVFHWYQPADPPLTDADDKSAIISALRSHPNPSDVHLLVFAFHEEGIPERGGFVGDSFTVSLIAGLTRRTDLRFVGRGDARKRLPPEAYQDLRCSGIQNCAVQLGRRAGVSLVITGTIGALEQGRLPLKAWLLETNTGVVLAEAMTEMSDLQNYDHALFFTVRNRATEALAEQLASVMPTH